MEGALENLRKAIKKEKKARENTLKAFDEAWKIIKENGDKAEHYYEVHRIISEL